MLEKANGFKNKNSDSLLYYYEKALDIAKMNCNYNRQADIRILQVESLIRSGKLLKALDYSDSLKSIVENNSLRNRIPDMLLLTGNVYFSMGLISESLDMFYKCLNDHMDTKQPKILIDSYYYIALAYMQLSEFSESKNYAKLSLKEAVENDLIKDALPPYMLLASLYRVPDSIQKFLGKADSIISLYTDLNYERVIILNNQARLNKALNSYKLSREQYLRAVNISLKQDFKENLTTLYNNYAYLLMAESKYDSAGYYLNQALDIAIDIGSLDMESEIYDSYSDYYSRIGDFESAWKYSGMFIEKRDEYRQKQQIQKSLFLSAVFKTEQKEKEILQQKTEILEQDNEINTMWIYLLVIISGLLTALGFILFMRQKVSLAKARMITMEREKSLELADAVISSLDAERKRLAMDLHDGMGARLGALRFIIDDTLESNSKYDVAVEYIEDIHKNVRNISHRMKPPELERNGLVNAIENFVNTIDISSGFKVDLELDIGERLSPKLESNIYFLIYELINNALKHSNGDYVFVQILSHGNEISISVEDNGTEFNHNNASIGMGMKNIHTRVEYLYGDIRIESTGSDTSIMIEIPI